MEIPKMIVNNTVIFHGIKLSIMATAINLAACNNSDFTDLHAYIAGVKARPNEPIKPLPEFENVDTILFKLEEGLRDPFKPVEKKPDEQSDEEPDNGIRPDKNRIKESLEAFPINEMKMVGTIKMNSVQWGLVKNDGSIYRVKVGNYLGKNDGKIIGIDKNKIDIIEIMPNKSGHFNKQSTTLMLAE